MLKTFATVCAMLVLTGCQTPRTTSSATEKAICDVFFGTLIHPSRGDTPGTIQQAREQWRDFDAACPGYLQ